jgi:anti-anti-sigma factor
MHEPDFTISQEEHNDGFTLVIGGELDLTGAAELEASVSRLCDVGAAEIAIDLRAMTFIDSSGLRAILIATGLCSERGVDFYVVPCENPVPLRLFKIAGVSELIPWRCAKEPAGD